MVYSEVVVNTTSMALYCCQFIGAIGFQKRDSESRKKRNNCLFSLWLFQCVNDLLWRLHWNCTAINNNFYLCYRTL